MLNFLVHSFLCVFMINDFKLFRIIANIHIIFSICCFPYIKHLFLLSKHKLFIFAREIFNEKFSQNFILRGLILQSSLYYISYLELGKFNF